MRSQPESRKPVTAQLYKPVSVVRETKWYFWKCNQRLTRGSPSVCFFYATANGQRWHVERQFRSWLAVGFFSLSASLFVQTWHEKTREPVNIDLQNDENPAGNSLYFTFCNTFPTSYSCTCRVCAGFVLYSVLTRWDVGVQSCPGGGWWVLEGCGSFWHLHSWAGRIASPDWNLSANGIHWHPQK